MDKNILNDYIDACALIRETEQQIRRLQEKQSETTRDSVRGSNPEFPYNAQHFKIEGTTFSMRDDTRLLEKKKLLADRLAAAEETRAQVERWMVTIPARMQRIIRWKLFEGLTWDEVAVKMGRNATGESVKKEFQRFFLKIESLSRMSQMSRKSLL